MHCVKGISHHGDGDGDKNSRDRVGMGTQPVGMGTGTVGTVGDGDKFCPHAAI